ncbi:MAG TPA: GNAT family N-acetyltransferase [Pyrinomonadaceae bacterium]|jgi:GNAT superfamily N-acetyltransferase
MSSNAQIKQFTLADTEALLAFLRAAYPFEPQKSDPVYWRWHHLENPFTVAEDVPLWVVRDGARIVGQLASIPVMLKVGGDREVRALWVVDIIVDDAYRGQGFGKRLMASACNYRTPTMALGMNEGSTAILRSLKWTDMGSIKRYQLLLNPGHAVKELAGVPALGRMLNLAYALFRRTRASEATKRQGARVRAVERFDADFDELWRRASAAWPCAVVRRADYLDWQFARQPGKKYETLGVYEAGGRLAGYIVLFFRKAEGVGAASPKVAISDLCYDAGAQFDVVDELLRAALALALARRAGSVVTDVLDARVEERLLKFGFWRIKRAPGFMVYSETERELVHDPRNWFLTRGDSDVSIFEHPNL